LHAPTECREELETGWIGAAAQVLLDHRAEWYGLVAADTDPVVGYHFLEQFFKSVGSLMSNQLRSCVAATFADIVTFFQQYAGGNDFGAEYTNDLFLRPAVCDCWVVLGVCTILTLWAPQVATINIVEQDGAFALHPPLDVLETTLVEIGDFVFEACQRMPRVEKRVFPDLASEDIFLHACAIDDDTLVQVGVFLFLWFFL
jgi:hypothetical protein